MESIWQKNMPELDLPTLDGDKRTDILIIGGGLAGVLCAWFLDKAGADYILALPWSRSQRISAPAMAVVQPHLLNPVVTNRSGVRGLYCPT